MNGDGYSPEVIALAAEMLQKHLELISVEKNPRKKKKKTKPNPMVKARKKEPLHQQERSARTTLKRKAAGEVGVRFKVGAGTRALLADLMEWSGIEEQAEALTLAIHHLHAKGRHSALQTLEYQVSIGETDRPEEIRMGARPGTMQAMAELMEWAGISDLGEFVEALIKRLHALGRVESIPLLSPPRHEIKLTEDVARKIQRLGRKDCLMLELDE